MPIEIIIYPDIFINQSRELINFKYIVIVNNYNE